MKRSLLVLMLLTSHRAFAVNVSVQEPCGDVAIFDHSYDIVGESSVGAVTIKTLTELEIPHAGAELGINSIFDTPTDMEAYDIISKSEMRAYGWCYSVNGFQPEELANEVFVENADKVLWWYGFAHYKGGEWISQCESSSLTPEFCRKNE